MVTSLYSEPIPVTEITSDWRKFHFPRDSRVITCVNLNLVVRRNSINSQLGLLQIQIHMPNGPDSNF